MKKYIVFFSVLLLIAFKTGDNKSQYNIPTNASGVASKDIDLDGDSDIIVGHSTGWEYTNPTITIIENIDNGIFEVADTSKSFCGNQQDIKVSNMNNDEYPDIVSFLCDFSSGEAERYIRIFYNDYGGFSMFQDFSLNTGEATRQIGIGDINGDTYNDIVVASHNGQFWGVMYNDGIGAFSEPEYHYVTGSAPQDIACADLNGDSRDEIVVETTSGTKVYFSNPEGFELLELESYASSVALADFDNDGDKDILLHNSMAVTLFTIYENLGDNTFQYYVPYNFPYLSGSFSITDFNNDSLPDVIFELYNWAMPNTEAFKIYLNKGDFQLDEPSIVYIELDGSEGPRHFHCADYDGNGYNDIALTRAFLDQTILEILFNDGNGNFVENPITNIETPNFDFQTSNLSCCPNPFETETTIKMQAEETSRMELSVFNLQGKFITNSIHNLQGGKTNTIKWDGYDSKGNTCPPGTYIVSLRINNETATSIKIIKLN